MGTFLDPDCDLPMFAAARAPAQQHSRTSMQAADSLDAKALNALQRKVLAWLAENGPATDEEMQEGLNMNPSTQRPRRIELAKRGLVVEAGVRMTKAKRAAVVWQATQGAH